MMFVAKEGAKARAAAEAPYRDPKWYEVKKCLANDLKVFKKTGGLAAGSAVDILLSPHHQAHGWHGAPSGSTKGALAVSTSLLPYT
jgi:hypothetical protein